MKKLIRTLQVYFPFLLDTKFVVVRWYRNTLKKPFEDDFNALSLFPPVGGAVFLDVGANRGQSTDAILMKRPDARVHLFEPNEHLHRKLQKMFSGQDGVVIYNSGLGDETTEEVLIVPFYRKWMFDGLASFDAVEAREWLKGRMFFYDDRFVSLRGLKCRVERLDDLGLSPFFIKIDVQGYEFKVLKGGEQTLRNHEPVLLIETSGNEIVEFLRDLGYDFYAYDRGRFRRGMRGALNTFFMTARKMDLVKMHVA